jgi:hypothetical protein
LFAWTEVGARELRRLEARPGWVPSRTSRPEAVAAREALDTA